MASQSASHPPALTAADLQTALRKFANPEQARHLQRFFKTAPGEYAHGDQFLGLKVPVTRQSIRHFRHLAPLDLLPLLHSTYHEERLAALLLWAHRFARTDSAGKDEIYKLYLANTPSINNWDLVDLSAPHIIGEHLLERAILSRQTSERLLTLARSSLLWDRRIAIVATHAFIRAGLFAPTLELTTLLLDDPEDLMHKACGWMLREVGKRHRPTLRGYLDEHAGSMPRTMLRYAIEHFSPSDRQHYLRKG